MPDYIYHCENCESYYEETRTWEEGPRKKCPECGLKEPIFYQDYGSYNQTIYIHNINTVGQQAAFNAKKAGKEKMQLMAEESKNKYAKRRKNLPGMKPIDRSKLETPFWRNENEKPLDVKKIRNVNKFIMEGK